MPAKVHTSKVLCYIVRDGQLLVFDPRALAGARDDRAGSLLRAGSGPQHPLCTCRHALAARVRHGR
jgi:hypothetical protein